ncbi:3-hydroxyisobutyrate dehydrogenase [Cryobacterium roopkundense]|uniref:3-hydroxyisobutyrate dehydrogenase n=1 Tax=Cryobacterium roopkundense TaxID=1001240 RepID=A0A099J2R4_9MICO|nr:3-hydroxyisobutyrate dehydrogenase [Cryobacterium roopkundense]KGJ71738.1 3-hydroxyisobutyrate dehydrogenase [Cryobacterium roopkundense]MBB5643004.1 3-hydroxyisobutyrate dehydrogenase [Cryobacterium roopkundense]
MAVIGWIGLGNMGGPMTANLVKAGHEVRGFDLSSTALEAAAAAGVTVATSIADAVAGADVVFTMLPKGEHARAVYLGDEGILASVAVGTLLIDSSTIDIESAQALHTAAATAGFRFVDAPVSGGMTGAQAGTLTFMIGGEAGAVADASVFIGPMSANIIPTGGATTGQAAKICNNLMLFINLAGVSEGAVLADRLGLDKQVFWNIASVSSGDSWALRTWYPIPGVVPTSAANNDFAPTFTAELAKKDIGLAVSAAQATDTPLEIGEHVQQFFQRMVDAGQGGKDCSMIVELVDGTLEQRTAAL